MTRKDKRPTKIYPDRRGTIPLPPQPPQGDDVVGPPAERPITLDPVQPGQEPPII